MTGLVSYGAYLPRRRLERMAIMSQMMWFAPGLIMAAQGERTMCNWDEDAMTMAVAGSRDCLRGTDKSQVEAVYMASTSMPFADRANAGILKAALNLPDEVATLDVTSTQKAGTSSLMTALETVKSGEKSRVLVTASDHRRTKTSWFHEMWYGDGAASLLVGNHDVIAEYLGSFSVTHDFVDHYRGSDMQFDYNWEERWMREEGYLKIIPQAVAGLLEKIGVNIEEISRICYPCFLGRAHGGVGKKLGASPEQIVSNMHAETGECGVAHPLVMLVRELEQADPGDKILVASFGQGCDALLFQVTDKIKALSERSAVSGALKRRKKEDVYTRYLKFRDLINTEMGIRAEAPKQTCLNALWRNRKLVLGFVGGKCRECGTAQIPASHVCVKPGCEAIDTQEDYEFADRNAEILSFTADLLPVSIDPPALYGMVQFEGGGRMLMDFTDCELGDLEVGVPVEMSFRKKYYDEERGFTGYFWKAVPKAQNKNGL